VLDLPVGHGGKPGEHVAEIGIGIEAASAATLDDGVEDGAAVTGVGIAQEQPVLFSKGSWPNGVFDQVIMYALKGVRGIRVQIPAGDIAPARSTGSGSGGNK
jgi:hypothetical protein